MQHSERPGADSPTGSEAVRPADSPARKAGLFLLLTALATVLMVVARVLADADQPTLTESLAAISESRWSYGASGAARLISGITLAVAAWSLLRTWIIRERWATPLVPGLFGLSAAFTAVSGACAVGLVVSTLGASGPAAAGTPDAMTEATAFVRWLTGKAGFSAGGLALLVAARYQWKAGGALRCITPLSVITGLAMQFIWVDALTVIHRVSGVAFVLWLLVMGFMLVTGRVERLFVSRSSPAISGR